MAASFAEVVALAKDRTPAGRRRLATQFSQAFFSNQSSFSSAERNLALDILTALIRDAALEVRRELAAVLAQDSQVPRGLILSLANDVIEVAGPVLQHSSVLTEPDLLAIIQSRSLEHRLAIAHRPQLPDTVTRELASTREVRVALALLGNISLHLSDPTLRLLAQQALESSEVGEAIAQRSELPQDLAEQIYWLISEELREQMRRRFDLNPGLIEKALGETVRRLAERQSDPATRRSLADRLVAGGTVTAPFLIDLLKNRGTDLFRDILLVMTKLRSGALDILLSTEGSESLALVCRALGFAKTETASLLMLVRDRLAGEAKFDPSVLADCLTTFARLTEGDAKTVLWQWQSDPSYLLSLGNRRPQ